MDKRIICIACPRGCMLEIDLQQRKGEPLISGNGCPVGVEYGRQEVLNPMRMLTTTVKTGRADKPRLPVRLSREIPKALISDCMEEINRLTVSKPCRPGDVLLNDILGTGADLISTGELD